METLDFILLILHLCYNLEIVINQNGQSASMLGQIELDCSMSLIPEQSNSLKSNFMIL